MRQSDQTEPDQVASYYDAWTKRYIDVFGDTFQAHRPTDDADFLGYLMRRCGLRPGKVALDAGCGVAGPARYFALNSGARIEALTISPVQAEIASERIADEGLQNHISVSVGDFHELESIYPRETFDIVYFLESLSHSSDPERVLRGAYHVLKPGGVIYIKDFFVRVCDDAAEQDRVLSVIDTVDRLFAVRTPWSSDLIATLRKVGFLSLFIERPEFDVDNSRWQLFERDNELDLFGGSESFDWSHWLELKFQKP